MILACHNLNKSFGDHLIVRDGSFHVEDREKAALVGVNGAGKSTIFKMIVGELPLDGGDVILTKGKTLGYLAQHQNLDTQNTIYEELKTAKSDIISLEEQIRSIELELKSLTGKGVGGFRKVFFRKPKTFEYTCDLTFVGIAVFVFKFGHQTVVCIQSGIQFISGE